MAKTTEASLKEITESFQNYKTISEQKATELKSSLEFARKEEGLTLSLRETMEDFCGRRTSRELRRKRGWMSCMR